MSPGVFEKTFRTWKCALDANERWLKGEIVNTSAVRVWCGICCKHVERLRCFRNFSEAFVTGIGGSAVKRDALTKHMGSRAHTRAEALENGPQPVTEILHTTAIGKPQKIISHASSVVII